LTSGGLLFRYVLAGSAGCGARRRFDIPTPPKRANRTIELRERDWDLGGRKLFQHLNLNLTSSGSALGGFVGRNGDSASLSLPQIILQELPAATGWRAVDIGARTRIKFTSIRIGLPLDYETNGLVEKSGVAEEHVTLDRARASRCGALSEKGCFSRKSRITNQDILRSSSACTNGRRCAALQNPKRVGATGSYAD